MPAEFGRDRRHHLARAFQIAINAPTYATGAATYALSGTVTDETHVEDVYVFVSNPSAKIDGRNVAVTGDDFTVPVPVPEVVTVTATTASMATSSFQRSRLIALARTCSRRRRR